MYCTNCGSELQEGAKFCRQCGAPAFQTTPSEEVPPPPAAVHPPYTISPPPLGTGPKRTGLWAGIAAALVIVIAAAAVTLVILLRDKDEVVTDTTVIVSTTVTMPSSTSLTMPSTTSSSITSTTTSTTGPAFGPPGDSPGKWVESQSPSVTGEILEVALSDDALLVRTLYGETPELYAYMFDSQALVRLPIHYPEVWSGCLSGKLAVWWEGQFDPETYERSESHIYAFPLPDGPKTEIPAGVFSASYYPQAAGRWVSWVEELPWQENPEEYREEHIFAVQVDERGQVVGNPTELVSSALAFMIGDSIWLYSLSEDHLAWEDSTPQEALSGTYIMDLSTQNPRKLGATAWRPSLSEDVVVYWEDGLRVADLNTLQPALLDPQGDFASAAPTYAAYYRYSSDSPGMEYEVVARGYTGAHEQLLGTTDVPPHFSPPIAVSGSRLAFIAGDTLRLFEWQGEPVR